jgi:hypothetical protein
MIFNADEKFKQENYLVLSLWLYFMIGDSAGMFKEEKKTVERKKTKFLITKDPLKDF